MPAGGRVWAFGDSFSDVGASGRLADDSRLSVGGDFFAIGESRLRKNTSQLSKNYSLISINYSPISVEEGFFGVGEDIFSLVGSTLRSGEGFLGVGDGFGHAGKDLLRGNEGFLPVGASSGRSGHAGYAYVGDCRPSAEGVRAPVRSRRDAGQGRTRSGIRRSR